MADLATVEASRLASRLASRGPIARATASIVHGVIDASELIRSVQDHAAGATALFLGTVRNVHDGRAVTGIEYHAYGAMAERELAAIAGEAAERFGTRAIAVEHRVGVLSLGDISVGIAAAHARRAPAFDAARFIIEQIKRRVPIWKRELYADGTREWVDPTRQDGAPARPLFGAPDGEPR